MIFVLPVEEQCHVQKWQNYSLVNFSLYIPRLQRVWGNYKILYQAVIRTSALKILLNPAYMKFWFVSVVPRHLNFVVLADLLTVFMWHFCHIFAMILLNLVLISTSFPVTWKIGDVYKNNLTFHENVAKYDIWLTYGVARCFMWLT